MLHFIVRWGRFFKKQWEVLTLPLPRLPFIDRAAAKLLMIVFGSRFRVEESYILNSIREPAVFVFNHNSYMETLYAYLFLLFHFRGEKPCFIVDWMFAHVPLVGWFIRRSDPVYVYRKRARFRLIERHRLARIDTINRCLEALRKGRSVGLFPEGKAHRDPFRLLKGREGTGHIVLASGVPVVPVGILPRQPKPHGIFTGANQMVFTCGSPMSFAASGPRPTTSAMRPSLFLQRSRRRAAAIIDLVMRNLSVLSGKEYPFRPASSGVKLTVYYVL